jgi:hypothetical protein
MVALRTAQAEEPLLQVRVFSVPQRKGEVEEPPVVAESEEPVLTPAIGAEPRVVVREVVPRIAVGGVILADGTPLPFAEIRPPAPPLRRAASLFEAPVLCRDARWSFDRHGAGMVPRVKSLA